jgi:hypothetical protein
VGSVGAKPLPDEAQVEGAARPVPPEVGGSGCRAAITLPALSGRQPWGCCAAERGATRRGATSATPSKRRRHRGSSFVDVAARNGQWWPRSD